MNWVFTYTYELPFAYKYGKKECKYVCDVLIGDFLILNTQSLVIT
jgi:hypothetical protein